MARSKQSKFKHMIGAPIRVLNKVRNLYMDSLMDCATRVEYSGPTVGGPAAQVPTLLPKSFYVYSSVNNHDAQSMSLSRLVLRIDPRSEVEKSEVKGKIRRANAMQSNYAMGMRSYSVGVANKDGVVPQPNLKCYLIGSPRTDSVIDENSKIVFAHRMALISDELYEAAKTSCNETYVNVDPSNTECRTALGKIKMCVEDLFRSDILEPKCVLASPKMNPEIGHRSVQEDTTEFFLSPPRIPEYWCRYFNYALSCTWSNDLRVQKALNVRAGTVLNWKRCNKSIASTKDIQSVVEVHKNLSTLGLDVLVEW
ncbi:hypothetical protein NL676_015833 [Syzygium grande]|nr:hypothetical protein NL676_015833 [Syzygium grande]